jgi:hypothetical protein
MLMGIKQFELKIERAVDQTRLVGQNMARLEARGLEATGITVTFEDSHGKKRSEFWGSKRTFWREPNPRLTSTTRWLG